MFDFLLELLKPGEKVKVKQHISKDFSDFLKNNNLYLKSDKSEICYIDLSNNEGFIKILPTSKYLNILKKYKEKSGLSDEWYNKLKDDFLTFYNIYEQKDLINKNITNMRFGKWVRNTFNLEPYDVESLVIKYKKFQKN